MKRKIVALLTAVLLMLTMITPAFADLIWEPYGDPFFEQHRSEINYHDRGYLANGQKGYVTVLTEPDSLSEVVNIGNGTGFYVVHVWTDDDGTQWGLGYPAGMFDSTGWVKLSEMAMIYDYISFEEDHSGEFKEYDGSGDGLTEALVYTYPGGMVGSTLTEDEAYLPFSEAFKHLYTDENGLRWTFVGYYMGHRDGWVCIDDPMNAQLGVSTHLTVGQVRGQSEIVNTGLGQLEKPDTQAQDEVLVPPAEEIPPARAFPLWIIPVILIVVVAIVTAVIVRKRNKAK